jgi:glycopeptide antibiotics resistance protein
MLHRHPVLSLLTGSYLAFVAWVTLTPQSYAAQHLSLLYRVLDALHRRGHLLSIDAVELEFLANIALFVPVGMFLLLLVGTRLWWVAIAASFAMSSFIEIAQRAIPGRFPDDQDVLANTMGAAIGVVVALVVTLPAAVRRRRQRLEARRSARVPAG